MNDQEKDSIARPALLPEEHPDPVLRISKYGALLYQNKAAQRLLKSLGCDKDHPLPDAWQERVSATLETGQAVRTEIPHGECVLALTFTPVINSGHVNVVGMDVTDYKQAEKKLEDVIASYEAAIRGTGDGLWDMWIVPDDPFNLKNAIHYSSQFKQLIGYRDHEFENVLGRWFSRFHPEDCDRALQAFSDHLDKDLPLDLDYRLRVKDGDYRRFNTRGGAIRNTEGRPIRLAGLLRELLT